MKRWITFTLLQIAVEHGLGHEHHEHPHPPASPSAIQIRTCTKTRRACTELP